MGTYSTPQVNLNLPAYQGTVPIDLLLKAGMMRQGEYDRHQAALQGNEDMLTNVPIIKDSDRQVVQQAASDMVDKTNQYSGQDLGDPRVFNKILGMQKGLINDDVMRSISSNQSAVTEQKQTANSLRDNPELFGATNMAVYNKQVNAWHNAPAGTPYRAQYTPFVDDTDWKKGVIDDLYKNPDTYIKTLPDGSKQPYATEELKVVLPQKIHDALMASMPSDIANQYHIDWQAGLDHYTAPGVAQEIDHHISTLEIKKADAENMLSAATTDKDKQSAQSTLDKINGAIGSLTKTKYDVITNNDPSLFHTYDSHLDQKFTDLGNAYAMHQESDLKYDPYKLALFNHSLDLDTEYKKASLKANVEQTNPVSLINSLETVGYYQKAQMNGDEMTHLIGNGAEVDKKDGSFNLTLHDRNVLADPQQVLKANGYDIDARKSVGMGDLMDKYYRFTKGEMPQGFGPAHNTTPGTTPQTSEGGEWSSSTGHVANTPSSKIPGTDRQISFNTFIRGAIKDNPGIVDYYKKAYGLDVTNSKDLEIANSIASNPKEAAAMTELTKNLTNAAGTFKVYPGDNKTNVIVGSGSELRGNVLIKMTKAQMVQFTDPGSIADDNYFALLHKGVIKKSGNDVDEKGNPIYQVSVSVPANKDLNLAVQNFAAEHATKKEGIDVAAEQLGLFKHKAQEISAVQPYIVNPDGAVKSIKQSVLSLPMSDLTKVNASNALDKAAETLKRDIPIETKKYVIGILSALRAAKNEDEIKKILSQ